ncbi:hypothetical protein PIB30_016804 [Stylosanthes scabra]|uniref:Uncharacterized protein n=1 Tax=Stylosanthes scabra TaxID=79078 RepID=A0ABU6S6V9_9FABA|nr:hypothetical protein [Stylosanthes scabra]
MKIVARERRKEKKFSKIREAKKEERRNQHRRIDPASFCKPNVTKDRKTWHSYLRYACVLIVLIPRNVFLLLDTPHRPLLHFMSRPPPSSSPWTTTSGNNNNHPNKKSLFPSLSFSVFFSWFKFENHKKQSNSSNNKLYKSYIETYTLK